MPKAKPVSLYPLSFEEALKAIIRVVPAMDALIPKKKRATVKPKKRKKS